MSSNLLKRNATILQSEELRIIDTNALIARRIQSVIPAAEDGFLEGLKAEDVTGLFEEAQGTEEAESYTGPAPEELLEEAKAEIEEMRREAAASLEEERRNTLEEAKNQGYKEGYDRGVKEAEQLKKELGQEKARLEQQFEDNMEQLEPAFVDTLTGIYEHLFQVELGNYRDILLHLIHSTMHKIEDSRNFIIHVSREDFPYVSMQKKQLMAGAVSANTNVEIIEDMAVGRNECLIEADGGIFDCGLGTQMEELSRRLRLLSYEKKEEA